MSSGSLLQLHGVAVLACAPDGPKLQTYDDIVDLIGDAMGQGAELVMLPIARLPDEFFTLSTGLAGELLQKLVNYRLRLAVVGDISRHVAASNALRDLVRESNRGNQAWFLATREELEERLGKA